MSNATPTLNADAFKVRSVAEWLKKWQPMGREAHWRDGKSSKELAKQWFPASGSPVIPSGFRRLLECHPATAAMQIENARGEKAVPLDDFKGETRNADLVLIGSSNQRRIIVHVEAKADEPFGTSGRSVSDASLAATRARPKSKVPERIANISGLLFGSREVSPLVGDLNYQLFFSVAGTLMDAEKEGAEVAVFIVHELLPQDLAHRFRDEDDGKERLMSARQISANGSAFARFVDALVRTHAGATCHNNVLWEIGAFRPFAAGRWSGVPIERAITLLIGKAADGTA